MFVHKPVYKCTYHPFACLFVGLPPIEQATISVRPSVRPPSWDPSYLLFLLRFWFLGIKVVLRWKVSYKRNETQKLPSRWINPPGDVTQPCLILERNRTYILFFSLSHRTTYYCTIDIMLGLWMGMLIRRTNAFEATGSSFNSPVSSSISHSIPFSHSLANWNKARISSCLICGNNHLFMYKKLCAYNCCSVMYRNVSCVRLLKLCFTFFAVVEIFA